MVSCLTVSGSLHPKDWIFGRKDWPEHDEAAGKKCPMPLKEPEVGLRPESLN